MQNPNRKLKRVRIAQLFFIINGILWMLMGIGTITNMSSLPDDRLKAWVIFFLMLVNAGAMLWIGIALGKRQRMVFYFALMLLIINIVLSITDDFGMLDLAALLLDVGLLGLLIATQSKYYHD